MQFDKINFSATGMDADQVCKNMRVYRGNGVKMTTLSVNSDFIPERALVRFDQEMGIGSGKLVRIPPAESMTGISITVPNKKPETEVPKSDLATRLGSPRGEREKGEVARHEDRDVEVIAELKVARDCQEARKSVQPRSVEKTKASERFELDSSFEKPVKKKNRKKKESSSSSEISTGSSDDNDGEPVTKDLMRLQSLRVEVEVSKLMRLKKKYRRQRRLLKKQKK